LGGPPGDGTVDKASAAAAAINKKEITNPCCIITYNYSGLKSLQSR